jgi:hypothetical protein
VLAHEILNVRGNVVREWRLLFGEGLANQVYAVVERALGLYERALRRLAEPTAARRDCICQTKTHQSLSVASSVPQNLAFLT